MNNAKIILSAVAAIAAIGGTLALKLTKSLCGKTFLYDSNGNGICTTAQIGYAYAPSLVPNSLRFQYLAGNATVTIQSSKVCSTKYYQFCP